MARIRKVTNRRNKTSPAPKIAFFHEDNLDNYVNTRTNRRYGNNLNSVVSLNRRQYKKVTYTKAKRRNGVVKFHRGRNEKNKY